MSKNNTALVFDIQKYSIHDGSGIRTLIFLKGCLLKCLWCSNPESQKKTPEIIYSKERCISCENCLRICPVNAVFKDTENNIRIDSQKCVLCGKCIEDCYTEALTQVGKGYNVSRLMKEIEKDISFYRNSGGGITFGGGEPLLYPDFIKSIAVECRNRGIPIAVETCGFVPEDNLSCIIENDNIDTVMFDIKIMDAKTHEKFCGSPNEIILNNFKKLNNKGEQDIVVRIPVIPGINDSESNIIGIADFIRNNGARVKKIELLPYHNLARSKYKKLGIEYKLNHISSPTKEELNRIKNLIKKIGVKVQIG